MWTPLQVVLSVFCIWNSFISIPRFRDFTSELVIFANYTLYLRFRCCGFSLLRLFKIHYFEDGFFHLSYWLQTERYGEPYWYWFRQLFLSKQYTEIIAVSVQYAADANCIAAQMAKDDVTPIYQKAERTFNICNRRKQGVVFRKSHSAYPLYP